MSTNRKPPVEWPKRPKGFYEDWTIFCTDALSLLLEKQEELLAAVLLAGGAVLGASGMYALVKANREAVDAKGREWGIEELGSIALSGGTLLGAAVGGIGGAFLSRTLGRLADKEKVNQLQARLTMARREFEILRQDLKDGMMDDLQHRLAVERLFLELTQV